MDKSSSKIKFFCSKYAPKVDTILATPEASLEAQDPLEDRLKSIESQVTKLVEYHESYMSDQQLITTELDSNSTPCEDNSTSSSSNIPLT